MFDLFFLFDNADRLELSNNIPMTFLITQIKMVLILTIDSVL